MICNTATATVSAKIRALVKQLVPAISGHEYYYSAQIRNCMHFSLHTYIWLWSDSNSKLLCITTLCKFRNSLYLLSHHCHHSASHTTKDIASHVRSSWATALINPVGSPSLPGEKDGPFAGRRSIITSQLGAATGTRYVVSSFWINPVRICKVQKNQSGILCLWLWIWLQKTIHSFVRRFHRGYATTQFARPFNGPFGLGVDWRKICWCSSSIALLFRYICGTGRALNLNFMLQSSSYEWKSASERKVAFRLSSLSLILFHLRDWGFSKSSRKSFTFMTELRLNMQLQKKKTVLYLIKIEFSEQRSWAWTWSKRTVARSRSRFMTCLLSQCINHNHQSTNKTFRLTSG